MAELWKDPSGEVQLSTVTGNSASAAPKVTTGNSEDNAKIAELRRTIDSLKKELNGVCVMNRLLMSS